MPKHFFFDLDNTLTRSKSHIAPEHKPILKTLIQRADVIVVSGHGEKDIRNHLEDVVGYYILAQNGNFAQSPDGAMLWEQKLADVQKAVIYAFIKKVQERFPQQVRDEHDLVDDRGCEVAFSLIGHHEKIEIKEAFDPDHKKRQAILADMTKTGDMKTLEDAGVEVVIGGTTVLDFIEKGKTKGFNVRQLIDTLAWKADECVYVGDALFPGGNDETVVGIIPTKAVKDYKETYSYLSELLV